MEFVIFPYLFIRIPFLYAQSETRVRVGIGNFVAMRRLPRGYAGVLALPLAQQYGKAIF